MLRVSLIISNIVLGIIDLTLIEMKAGEVFFTDGLNLMESMSAFEVSPVLEFREPG